MAVSRKKFEDRTDLPNTHPLTSYLCKLIVAKKTNLCLSADVSSSSALIKVAEEVGDYICVLKTHADAIDDFGEKTAKRLKEIARRKKFLIFEDRKFGDIGSTVQKQYSRGPLRIAEWAHIVNAHVFPGPAIITALKQASEMTLKSLSQSVSTEVYAGTPMASEGEGDDEENGEEVARQGVQGSRPDKADRAFTRKGSIVTTTHIYQTVEPREGHRSPNRLRSPPNESALDEEEDDDEIDEPPVLRGLLLLAQMSSAGNLMNESYSKACAEMARANRDFVMGFITQETLNQEGDNFLCLAPGVNLPAPGAEAVKGDALGQQYRTPKMVIGQGIDIIIVGRGILGASDRAKEARRYRDETWAAYESLVES